MHRPDRQSRNAEVDFLGKKRSNATHASTTDPDARLYKKSPGTGAMLCFIGRALKENRSGLVVQADLTRANGHAEWHAALGIIHAHSSGSTRQLTLGAASTRQLGRHDSEGQPSAQGAPFGPQTPSAAC